METDCLTFIQAIRCSSVNLSYLGRVIDEGKLLLSQIGERNDKLEKFFARARITPFLSETRF